MKKKVLSVLLALLMVLSVFMPLASGANVLNVSVTSGTDGNIASWDPVLGATHYEITITNPTTPYTNQVPAFTVPATHPTPAQEEFDLARITPLATLNRLVPGTSYRIRVRALSGAVELAGFSDATFTMGHFAPIPSVSGGNVSFTALPAGHGIIRYEIELENLTQPVRPITRIPVTVAAGSLSTTNVAALVGSIAHPGLLPAAEYRVRIVGYVHGPLGYVETNDISAPTLITVPRTLTITSSTGAFSVPRPAVNASANTLQLAPSLAPVLASNPAFVLASQEWSFIPAQPTGVFLSGTGELRIYPTAVEQTFTVQLRGQDISGNWLATTQSITITPPVSHRIAIDGPSTINMLPGTDHNSQQDFTASIIGAPLLPSQHIEWHITGPAAISVFPTRGPTTRVTAGATPGSATLVARIMQDTTIIEISAPVTITIQAPTAPARTIRFVNPPDGGSHVVPLNTPLNLVADVTNAPGVPVTWHNAQFVGNPGTTGTATTITGNMVTTGSRPGTFIIEARAADTPPRQLTLFVGGAHTVTFRPNGGTWPTDAEPVQETAGTFASALEAVEEAGLPRRFGHAFVGWFDTADATGGNQILPASPILSNREVWARWRPLGATDATTEVPANSTLTTIFPDANLRARVVASLNTHFGVTNITATSPVFASDLAAIETLNLTRAAAAPIVDLRGIPTLTGVTEVTPATGLTNQTITLPNVPRAFPLDHTNVVRGRDSSFIVPTTISNNGTVTSGTTPPNNTIRWATAVPSNVLNVTYAWNVAEVLIGNQNVVFSGTATLPFRAPINFVDVNSNNWFYAAVNFVAASGYMSGTTTTPPLMFEPTRVLTRAEVAVILHRMAGSPAVTGPIQFTDVTAAWQVQAVNWAARNDIVNGIGNNLFSPNTSVTREQFAAMFHRFAVFSQIDVTVPGNVGLTQFPDHADVSSWAVQYLRWATHTGLITGTTGATGTILNPGGTATRAECAQMIQRFATTIR